MDVRITLKHAEAELREISGEWRKIGCELGMGGDLHIIGANHGSYSERCLSEVLSSWIRNERNPSWDMLCNALENAGLQSKAKKLREKYSSPSTPGTQGDPEHHILLRDRKVETASWSIPGVYTKKDETEISRGELLIKKGDLLCVNGNESVAFEYHTENENINIAPLFGVQYNLLKAIQAAKGRFPVFKTDGWMDWGADVKKGDEVYIRVIKDDMECCSTAVVHYIGSMTEEHPGIMFGVEITDARYYGCGTSDGTFNKARYFTCPDNNGLFLSLASVANQPAWLNLEYHPKKPTIPEGMQKGSNNAPIRTKRSTKEPSQVSASANVEEGNRGIVDTQPLPHGTRVMIMTKDGKKVNGTVRWAGELPLEGEDAMKKKIPVYGVETDIRVSYNQIEPVIVVKGRPQFGASADHGRVFIPQTMVELGEQTNGSDTTGKNTDGTKDTHQEAGVDNEGKRQAVLKTEDEKAALAQLLGPEIARETNVKEQVKALEEFKKAVKQREDNTASNKDVYAGGSSQYPAVQHDYHHSNSQLGRQSSYTQDPHQDIHQPSVVIPAHGHWAAEQHVGIGSAVVISNSNPPIGGTIRWIGTMPQVNGYVAGVELEAPMAGCTDGVWVQKGVPVRYFDCPPNKGYFCQLEQLVPDQRFMASSKDLNNPMKRIPEEVSTAGMADGGLFFQYIGDEKGIQGHQNSCYLDATLFGLFALSSCFDELFLKVGTEDNQSIENIIWKKIVNPLRSCGAARYESVMALRERLDNLGKMKGITKDEKDPEEFLNMLFKHVLHPDPFIEIRRPYGIEGEFFVQLFFESEANSDATPTISDMLHRMFTEQNLSFTKAPQWLLIQVPRFGKQFKTYKRVIPNKKLNVSKLVHTHQDGFCCWCDSPAAWKCKECATSTTDGTVCSFCSDRRHKSMKFKGHNPVALQKRTDVELDLLSVICIETSHYVCFSQADDRWLFFDSMANRIGDKYNIPRCTNCTHEINGWVYEHPEKLHSTEPKPELVRRFTQDVYMCVYVVQDVGMY